MTVNTFQSFHRHPQMAGDGPDIGTLLHQPGCPCVTQRVPRNTRKVGRLDNALPRIMRIFDGVAVVVTDIQRIRSINPFPSPQVR